MKYNTTRLEIKLPEDLKKRLTGLTSASGFSMSDVVRWSLIRGIQEFEKELKNEPKETENTR